MSTLSAPPIACHEHNAMLVRDLMEDVARSERCGYVLQVRVGDDLVVVSSSGGARGMQSPAFAGLRQPFLAPLGAQLAACANGAATPAWVSRLVARAGPHVAARVEELLETVRRRGYSVTCEPDLYARLVDLVAIRSATPESDVEDRVAALAVELLETNEPMTLEDDKLYDVWAIHAAVGTDTALSIGLYPIDDDLVGQDVRELGARIVALADDVAKRIGA